VIGAFDSPLLSALFGDGDVAEHLGDASLVRQMVAVEAAYARACEAAGVIPEGKGAEISAVLARVTLAPDALGAGVASAGVPVPALVKRLKAELGALGNWLHWGATSQDIVDTAMVLQWRGALDVIGARLTRLLDALEAASAAGRDVPMAARTRSQSATPISFGLRVAHWAQPLIAAEAALPEVRSRLLRVQFGGASGSASAVGEAAPAVSMAFARELDLADGPAWHTDRSAVLALGQWLVSLTAALSKMARDLILMGRRDAPEARFGAGGGSSTMPQKANPVGAEAIVSLGDYAALLQAGLARAATPLEERDGAAWALEWLCLPQMGLAAGAALRHALSLAESLEPRPEEMAKALAADGGAVLAEAAVFALAEAMPRAKAQSIVGAALETAMAGGCSLAEAVAAHPDAPRERDWAALLTVDAAMAPAQAMAARIFAERARPARGGQAASRHSRAD
jgi:3-carboxy-cis,cis-muconate cycloisomerase